MLGFVSLYDYYSKALKNNGSTYNVNDLFEQRKAKAFIKKRFNEERGNEKIKECIEGITDFRAIHTVSAFFLGFVIKDQLKIDTREWRRLPGENSPKGSFELFWSWICLFHDIGYKYEDDYAKSKTYKTIDGFIRYLKLDYNLLEESKNKELIINYFRMRIDDEVLDHGIVGALLLYNALMDLAENSKLYSSIKEYKSFFVAICDTIALHNMWRASTDNIDKYERYGLWELIPGDDLHHIVFYKDNPILFLLALVDTIEPIKKFSHDGRSRNPVTGISVLQNMYVRFVNGSGVKKLTLSYNNPDFHSVAHQWAAPDGSLLPWVGVFVNDSTNPQGEGTLSISVDLARSALVESIDEKVS